jgi:hypothetical protein
MATQKNSPGSRENISACESLPAFVLEFSDFSQQVMFRSPAFEMGRIVFYKIRWSNEPAGPRRRASGATAVLLKVAIRAAPAIYLARRQSLYPRGAG